MPARGTLEALIFDLTETALSPRFVLMKCTLAIAYDRSDLIQPHLA